MVLYLEGFKNMEYFLGLVGSCYILTSILFFFESISGGGLLGLDCPNFSLLMLPAVLWFLIGMGFFLSIPAI